MLIYPVKDSTVSRQAPDFHHKRKPRVIILKKFSKNGDSLDKFKTKLLKMNN